MSVYKNMRYKSSRKNTYRGGKIKRNISTRKKKKGKKGGTRGNPSKWMKQLAVKQLMNDNLSNNTSGMEKYLTKVCPDSNNCLAFGPDAAVVKEYFENFDSKYVDPNQTTNLATGNSGDVNKLVYRRGKYTTTALLKTSTRRRSDNLLLEAYIGYNYINVQSVYFPCFINTYGAFKGKKRIEIPFPATEEYVNLSCSEPTSNGVLIQNIDNAETLHSLSKTFHSLSKTMRNAMIFQILYQVYAVLSELKNEFTHYDLHANNVVLYKVPNNKVIEMKYYGADGTLKAQFNTMYIAKMIDYGRCYTPLNAQYYDMVCKATACSPPEPDTPCGHDDGYQLFYHVYDMNNYYMSMLHPNISNDLRLANLIGPAKIKGKKIYNVDDMAESLRLQVGDDMYPTVKKMATLGIYLDRSKPMKYELAAN